MTEDQLVDWMTKLYQFGFNDDDVSEILELSTHCQTSIERLIVLLALQGVQNVQDRNDVQTGSCEEAEG